MGITVRVSPRVSKPKLSILCAYHVLVVMSILAVSICYDAEVSYAGSRAVSTYYPAFGSPGDVVVAKTGDVLVSLSSPDPGIQIFSPTRGFANPCGGRNIIKFDPPIVKTLGMALFSDRYRRRRSSKQSISVAVEQSGAAFLLADLRTCSKESIVVAQQPVGQNCTQCPPGSADLAVTPKRWFEYAFVANEYGETESPSINKKEDLAGTVGVIRIARNRRGKFGRRSRPIHHNPYLYIPGGDTIPEVTMSHDGKYLFVVNEISISGTYPRGSRYYKNPYSNPTGISNGDLATDSCINQYPQSTNTLNNGVLTIIDVDKATRGWGQRSIIQTIASGCSPVRVVETADGQYIFVATRGGNPRDSDSSTVPEAGSLGRIIVFDVSKLLSRDLHTVNEALVNVIKNSGGTAPVGLALFEEDQRLAVANSNRNTEGETGTTSVAIINVHDPSAVTEPEVICPSPNIFSFPRAVTSDGTRVYVANFGNSSENVSGSLQVITTVEDSTFRCMVGPYPGAQN